MIGLWFGTLEIWMLRIWMHCSCQIGNVAGNRLKQARYDSIGYNCERLLAEYM